MLKVPRQPTSQTRGPLPPRLRWVILISFILMALVLWGVFYLQPYYYFWKLRSSDSHQQLQALRDLAPAAAYHPDWQPRFLSVMENLLTNPDPDLRSESIVVGRRMLDNDPGFQDQVELRLNSSDDQQFAVWANLLQEAGRWSSSLRSLEQRCRLLVQRSRSPNPDHRASAVFAMAELGPPAEDYLQSVLTDCLTDESALVRYASVVSASICLPHTAPTLLTSTSQDEDDLVRSEAQTRLSILQNPFRPPPAPVPPIDQIQIDLKNNDPTVRLHAIRSLGRILRSDLRCHDAIELLKHLSINVSADYGSLTLETVLESLAALGDESQLPLMTDIASGYSDQPMLRLAAALAVAQLDPESGISALANLFDQPDDTLRDWAAWSLADHNEPSAVERLKSEFFSLIHDVRGPAALALALHHDPNLILHDAALIEWLRRRMDLLADNKYSETEWKPRGYYSCSLLILGDASARKDIDLLLLNEHFPRLAVFITLLDSGETTPLDLLLSDDPMNSHLDLWIQQRFSDIVAHFIPDAPLVDRLDSPESQQHQIEFLARWWSIQRWRLTFDPASYGYSLPH